MVRQFVNFMLGDFGRQVLAFYIDHSLAINGAIVVYGILMLLAHLNLRRIEKVAMETVRRRMSAPASDGPGSQHTPLSESDLPWQAILDQASFFPLVARGNGLVPRPSNVSNLRKLIPISQLTEQIAAESQQRED